MSRHTIRTAKRTIWSFIFLGALAMGALGAVGCGGAGGVDGDGDGGQEPTERVDEVLTGTFGGSPVSGVSYESTSYSGVTGANGEFQYEEGEMLVFRIGGTELGRSVGKPSVTPFELVADAEIAMGRAAVNAGIYERSPFAQVINISVLLQTLDQDGDPRNGLEITEAVAAALDDVALELNQKSTRFMWDLTFRSVLAAINEAGLLDEPGIVRSPDLAIQHLYAVLEVEPRIFAAGMRETDSNADGVVDSRSVSTFDEWGHGVRHERDSDGDGVADSISYEIWNEDGRPAAYEYDQDGDGTIDSVSRYTYDELGNEVRRENGDGQGNLSSVTTQDFDRLGRVVRRERDSDADGEVDSVTTTAYQGGSARQLVDSNADGVVDQISRTERDELGNIIRREQDRDADGGTDWIEVSDYDARGHRIFRSTDDDGDGSPESTQANTYNEDGLFTRQEQDTNGDGAPERITEHLYEEGGLVQINTYLGLSETPSEVVQYTRNEAGHVILSETYRDGVLASSQVNEVDEYGNAIRRERDSDGDGVLDEIEVVEYVQVGFAWEFDF